MLFGKKEINNNYDCSKLKLWIYQIDVWIHIHLFPIVVCLKISLMYSSYLLSHLLPPKVQPEVHIIPMYNVHPCYKSYVTLLPQPRHNFRLLCYY